MGEEHVQIIWTAINQDYNQKPVRISRRAVPEGISNLGKVAVLTPVRRLVRTLSSAHNCIMNDTKSIMHVSISQLGSAHAS